MAECPTCGFESGARRCPLCDTPLVWVRLRRVLVWAAVVLLWVAAVVLVIRYTFL